ncbi:MAG: hypothetical protein QM723_24415 [Myxococcaceae bacterium]
MTALLLAVLLSGDPACHLYSKRCEPACRQAHREATSPKGACAKEVEAFNAAMAKSKAGADLGKCVMACAPKDDMTCVGPPSQPVCDCQRECFKKHAPDAIDPGKAMVDCADKSVAKACQ